MIEAIFFDFDGVVVDSEPIHAKTKILTLDAYQISYPSDIFDQYKGIPEKNFFVYVSKHLDPQHRPYNLLIKKRREYLSDLLPEMPIVEGFLDFINFIRTKNILTALVTSSSKDELEAIDKYLHIISLFDTIVSSEATNKHKPAPDPYLKALKVTQIDTKKAIVIEDSFNGIISGKEAGCQVYALTTTFPKEVLLEANADKIYNSFSDLKKDIINLIKIE